MHGTQRNGARNGARTVRRATEKREAAPRGARATCGGRRRKCWVETVLLLGIYRGIRRGIVPVLKSEVYLFIWYGKQNAVVWYSSMVCVSRTTDQGVADAPAPALGLATPSISAACVLGAPALAALPGGGVLLGGDSVEPAAAASCCCSARISASRLRR